MDDAAPLDEVHDMANLSEARTGIPGVVWISTRVARHGPRVKYFEKPGSSQPSFAVSIMDEPEVVATSLPERVVDRLAPQVIAWVRLNKDALLAFWNDGDTWLKEQVDACIDGMQRI